MHLLQKPENISRLFPKWLYWPAGIIAILIFLFIAKSFLPSFPDKNEIEENVYQIADYYPQALEMAIELNEDAVLDGVSAQFKTAIFGLNGITFQFGSPDSVLKNNIHCQNDYCKFLENRGNIVFAGLSIHEKPVLDETIYDLNDILMISHVWLVENQVSGWTTIQTISLLHKDDQIIWHIHFYNAIHTRPIYITIDPLSGEILEDPYNK